MVHVGARSRASVLSELSVSPVIPGVFRHTDLSSMNALGVSFSKQACKLLFKSSCVALEVGKAVAPSEDSL